MIWTYSLITDTLPAGMDRAAFAACIARALRATEKAAHGQVLFSESLQAPSSKLQASSHHVNIGFEQLAGARQSGSKMTVTRPDGSQVHSIAFDTRWRWAATWVQRLLMGVTGRQCMLSTAMHELGHLLGLDHSDDEWSCMFEHPRMPKFNDRDMAALLYLTRDE